ncbi:hypothetical protein THAOC_10417, partial [Thalassiosira oceanica]
AGRGRLKPGVRQNRVTTALGARRLLGLPLQNATCLLASTPCPSAFNQLWRWGPVSAVMEDTLSRQPTRVLQDLAHALKVRYRS